MGVAHDRQHTMRDRKRGGYRRQEAAVQQLGAIELDQTNASRRPLTVSAPPV